MNIDEQIRGFDTPKIKQDDDNHILTPKWTRFYTDLRPRERALLKTLRSENDIHTLKLISVWEDDHVACWGLEVNNVGIAFWWNDNYEGACTDWMNKKFVFDQIYCLIESLEDEDDWLMKTAQTA